MYSLILYVALLVLGYQSIHSMLKSNPKWIIYLAVLSFLSTSVMYLFEATTVFTVVSIFGIQIHMDDVILLILLTYSGIHFAQKGLRISKLASCMLMIIIPVCVSLLRGVAGGFLGNIVFMNDIRKYFYFAVAMIAAEYTFSDMYGRANYKSCKRSIDVFMNIVAIYVLIIWGMDVLLGINNLPGQQYGTLSDGGSTFRIIQPQHVLMIAFYSLWELYNNLKEDGDIKARTVLFCGIVILMQWRTVVAAFLVGAVLVFIDYFKERKSISHPLFFKIAVLTVLCILTVLFGTDSGESANSSILNLFTSFESVSSKAGTFGTRTLVWTALLQSLTGLNMFIGRPFGMHLRNALNWEVSAHSGYVDYIMSMGYIGLLLFVLLLIVLLTKLNRQKIKLFFIILICMIVYWIGYGFSVHQGFILGTIVAAIKNQRKQNRTIELEGE